LTGLRTGAIAVLLAVLVATLYITRLGFAPVYLMHDESQFALQAQAIAATGHDLSGRRLPIYFTEPEFPAGRDPVIIYATAVVLKALPLSESSVRLATALTGVLNIVLMFLVGRRLFKNDLLALIAAMLMALTPAHFIRSRLVLSPLYSIPFILAWLLWLARFLDRPDRRTLSVAAAWLGLGVYTYLACMVMMPVYLLLTAWIAFRQQTSGWRSAVLVGFLVPLLPMAAWYATHPERYTQIIEAYKLYSAGATPVEGAARIAADDSVRLRLNLVWSFFSPDFLFISGDSSLINSTRQTGFFPLAFAVLIPAGIYQLARNGGDIGKVILAGFVTAPLASVVSGAIEMNRIMFAIPFGVLTAAFGARALLDARHRLWRWAAVALLVSVPLQFTGFYRDYMGRYREQSSFWFGGNLRAALTDVIRMEGRKTRPVYISRTIPFANRYWRFYTLVERRGNLTGQATFYEPQTLDAATVPPGSHLVCALLEGGCEPQASSDMWTRVSTATEPDGTESFAVYERR
jgi:4-amino-4-deoxy-L-arabinose transferase-like glycosyltransferase